MVLFILIFGFVLKSEKIENPIFIVLFFIGYISVVCAPSVLIHTRELAERQIELLKQIQFQLTQNIIDQRLVVKDERKDPVI